MAQPAAPATLYTTANSPLPDNAVAALCYDAPRARLWVGTDYGLARLDLAAPGGPAWTIYHATPGGLPAEAVRAVALADSGTGAVWVGTFQGGLARFDVAAGTWQTWNAATSPLPLDQVRALAPEPDGGVWIGTAGGLAHRTAAGAWQVLTPFNSALPSGNVASLVRNPTDSTVWVGTVNGGLARWRRGAVQAYTIRANNLPDNTVLSLALDSAGAPVLGTAAAGLVRYRSDSTWAAYGPLTSPNPAATILALAQDSLGQRWLGTSEKGLVGYSAGQWTAFAFRSAAGLPDSTIQAVAVGAGGDLWLGLRSGGLARWRPGPLGAAAESAETGASVTLWPNPAGAGQAVRVSELGRAATIRVYDACGQLVGGAASESGGEALLPPLSPGFYAVRVTTGGRALTRRLVIVSE